MHALQVAAVLPWSSHHHHQTRCFAHVLLHSLLQHFPPDNAIWARAGPCGRALLHSIQTFASSNPAAAKLIASVGLALPPDSPQIGSLQALLAGHVTLAGANGSALEWAPQPLMDRIDRLLQAERHSKRVAASAAPAAYDGSQQGTRAAERLSTLPKAE